MDYIANSQPIPDLQSKRKLSRTDFEVPDSDGEDYGWADEDEDSLPAPPPQWQGSEDILLGQEIGNSDDEGAGSSENPDSPAPEDDVIDQPRD